MERYTLQQRIEIIKIHYKNGENCQKMTASKVTSTEIAGTSYYKITPLIGKPFINLTILFFFYHF